MQEAGEATAKSLILLVPRLSWQWKMYPSTCVRFQEMEVQSRDSSRKWDGHNISWLLQVISEGLEPHLEARVAVCEVQFLLSTTKPLFLHGCGMRTGSSLPRRAVEGPQVMDARWGNSAILPNFEEGGG